MKRVHLAMQLVRLCKCAAGLSGVRASFVGEELLYFPSSTGIPD